MKKNIQEIIKVVENKIKEKNYDDAIIYLEEMIKNDDENYLLGLSTIADIHVMRKDFSQAIIYFDKIIQINPKLPFIYNNKGYVLLKTNKIDEAKECFSLAIKYKKDFFEALNNFGIVLQKQGLFSEAEGYFKKSIDINNNYIDAYDNLIKLEIKLNNLNEAENLCKKLNKVQDNRPNTLNNLGIIYKKKNKINDSTKYFEKAVKNNENYLPGLINLAKNYFLNNDFKNSKFYFEKAINIDKNNVNALSSYIYLKLKTCDFNNLEQMKERLFHLTKNENKKIQPYIFLLLNDDIKFQKVLTTNWATQFIHKNNKKNIVIKNKKIKIGYFSTDFHKHAVITLTKNLFNNHDKDKFELYGFNLSNITIKTQIDISLLNNFTNFFDCKYKTNSEIEEICNNLNIDFAIDMNMYTHGARPDLFTNKLAPIQINYLGYPGTSGSDSFDYIVADKNLITSDLEKFYSEKIIFMPDTYQPNSFESYNIPNIKKNKHGLPENKFIFCCLSNCIKINEFVLKIWAEILNNSKNSILWLLNDNLTQIQNLKNKFKELRINESQIFFSKKVEYKDHLERLSLPDIYLDTYPYGGHTTAIEALNSNLPIITLEGESFQSRVSSSLLKSLNLIELVCKNKNEYINKAIELYNNEEYLYKVKQKLINNKKKSKIFDNKTYTLNFENELKKIYLDLTD